MTRSIGERLGESQLRRLAMMLQGSSSWDTITHLLYGSECENWLVSGNGPRSHNWPFTPFLFILIKRSLFWHNLGGSLIIGPPRGAAEKLWRMYLKCVYWVNMQHVFSTVDHSQQWFRSTDGLLNISSRKHALRWF